MKSRTIFKPLLAFIMVFAMLLGVIPVFPVALASTMPNVSHIASVQDIYEYDSRTVTMNGIGVGTARYLAMIDGVGYEAFCADPGIKGPEQAGAVYELSGEAHTRLRNALVNGYTNNSEWSNPDVDEDSRVWYVYVTRVAVAMANHPSRTFGGEAITVNQARSLANGTYTANHAAYPAIMVNGVKDGEDTGRAMHGSAAQSDPFEVTHNRKLNQFHNPFRFEWAAGTPDGAKLIVDGNVIATAPTNPTTIYKGELTSFVIEMPNTAAFEGKTAAVNLVGIHNQFADKIWMMQNPNDPDGWQDIVFYIPEVSASAAFSFISEPDEPTIPTLPNRDPRTAAPPSIRIQKVDALSRQNIPGALIRLSGGSSFQMTTGDGQIWEIDNTGIDVSVVLTAGATLPVVSSSSGGNPPVEFEVTDGVLTIHNIPWGYYKVEEERAPDGYSLLPQHTAYSFWVLPPNVTVTAGLPAGGGDDGEEAEPGEDDEESGGGIEYLIDEDENVTSVLITFENYPFGSIEVTKYDEVTGQTLAGTHFRIQGYFAEGNTNGLPIDRVQVTGGDGKTVFDKLPAGQYTISEVEAPPGYELDSTAFRSISLTWGQTASTSFYNKPKTFVEVIKVDGDDSSRLLDGAIFRLTDPTSGEIWEGTTSGGRVRLGAGDGSFGNQLVENKLYILTEIQAPNGYILDSSPIEVIVAADNQLNTVTVRNFRKPTLTIRKYDELTNEPLAGASFRLWRTEGATWSETQVTDANGVIVWTDLDPGIYSVQEIDEPYGYFRDPARKEILLEGGDNKELQFFNRPRPVLTIFKRDQVTLEPLEGVRFRVQALEGLTVGEFVTDANGMIELSPRTGYLLDERIYRVTEIQPPEQYLLGADPVRDVLLKWYEPTELVFENLLKPTIIFIKRDGMSGRGISGATYRVQYESPTGGITTLGSYVTKCGLIVIPYVTPGWYILTETSPAPGYSLPTNPTVRVNLAPGENSYTHSQTNVDVYVDRRTDPGSGSRGMCGDCCGFMCSVLCAGNCGNPGDGTMAPGNSNSGFGNITITNGNGDPLGTDTTPPPADPAPTPTPDPPPDFSGIVITGGTIVYLNPAFPGITITFGNKEE